MLVAWLAACGFRGNARPVDATPDDTVVVDPDDNAAVDPGIPASGCGPLAPAVGAREVTDVSGLVGALATAPPDGVITLAAGVYELGDTTLQLATPGVVLRSASGDPTSVTLRANGRAIVAAADRVTIAAMTIRDAGVGLHAISAGASITGVRVHAMRFIDTRNGIVINSPAIAVGGNYADEGLIACSTFEATDDAHACAGSGALAIDATAAAGWTVRDNRFENFSCSTKYIRTIRFYRGSRDLALVGNTFVNCAGNVLLGWQTQIGDLVRAYPDAPSCSGVPEYRGGLACNNVITGLDVREFGGEAFQEGLALWTACDVAVAHNTIVSPMPTETFSAIEYRFASTRVTLVNNLVARADRPRDGAMTVGGNASIIYGDPALTFVDPRTDLHLLATTPTDPTGTSLSSVPPECHVDRDGTPRDPDQPSAGAYER